MQIMKHLKAFPTACLIIAILAIPAILSLIPVSPVCAMETTPDGYPIPSLEGFTYVRTFSYDGDSRVPGKESKIDKWVNGKGDTIYINKFNGDKYSYLYVPAGDKYSSFAIVAWKEKGIYEQRYGYHEEWDIPDRLLK